MLATRTRPDKTQLVLGRFGQAGAVSIKRVSANLYTLMQSLGDGLWWALDWENGQAWAAPPPGGFNLHQLHKHRYGIPMLSVNQEDASVVRSGTWSTLQTAVAGTFGGNYRHNNNNASTYVEYTSPANTIALGLHKMRINNGGYGLVTIDGDATRANRLPTAQQEVDAGRLASSALVANGGTLNPTDRVIEFYNSSTIANTPTVVADGLTAGVHTLRVTHTGYKRAASSAARIYDDGYSYALASTTPATASASVFAVGELSTTDSSWNMAIDYKPDAGGSSVFCGEVHGYEDQQSMTIAIDGAASTLTDGQVADATSIVIDRVSHLKHPDSGATVHAICTGQWRFTARGMEVTKEIAWQDACTVQSSYAAMFPCAGALFDKGAVIGAGDLDLSISDDAQMGKKPSPLAYLWDTDGEIGVYLYSPNAGQATNDWLHSASNYLSIQRRSTSDVRKVYLSRVNPPGGTEAVGGGTTWRSTARWGIKRFPNNGADYALRGLA